MPARSRRIPEAVLRLLIVAALLVGAVAVVYVKVLPPLLPSFRNPEYQQRTVLEHETSKDLKYAGALICSQCHDEQSTTLKAGYHRNVSCETCHGPSQAHVLNFTEVKPRAPRGRQFCPTCHAYQSARPMGFPQINPVTHNPMEPCITCHQAHDPKPPTVPGQCAACHGEIERTKAVSPHALLECTTCHTTPEQHKITPWNARATKPQGREFCGTCHGLDGKDPEIMKVDVATHEEKYLCWQCHYPHMPEVER